MKSKIVRAKLSVMPIIKGVFMGAGILIANPTNAQIQLEHSYTNKHEIDYPNYSGNGDGVIHLHSGWRILRIDTLAKKFKLYNTDHTLWKTIDFPIPPNGYMYSHQIGADWYPSIDFISEKLFNSDNSIEFITSFVSQPFLAINPEKNVLMNEHGNVIQTFDCYFGGVSLIQYDNQYKLRVLQAEAGSGLIVETRSVDIYSLPGNLPCDPCNDGLGFKDMNSGSIETQIFPNPSSNSVTIRYDLPHNVREAYLNVTDANGKTVKTIRLANDTKSISINNGDLPSGTYYCNIFADGASSTGKKMIVLN